MPDYSSEPAVKFWLIALLICCLWPVSALAQLGQIEDAIGGRIETLTILSGDQGTGGGAYAFRGDVKADLKVFKLGGAGAVARRRPLGIGSLQWSPMLVGNIGFGSTDNEFLEPPLTGNNLTYDTFAIQVGVGSRFHFTTDLSLALTVAGIYGHTENKFEAHNAAGEAVKDIFSGSLVDWTVSTWTIVPGVGFRYQWRWKRNRFEFESNFRYYHTESFGSSSSLIQLNNNSQVLENKLDADIPLGLKVFGQELHTGGFFARSEIFGDLRGGLDLDHLYSARARLVMDLEGKLWKVRWLGVGATYYFFRDVSGWGIGVDARIRI